LKSKAQLYIASWVGATTVSVMARTWLNNGLYRGLGDRIRIFQTWGNAQESPCYIDFLNLAIFTLLITVSDTMCISS